MSGALGSIAASGWTGVFCSGTGRMIAFGALAGGIGAELSGDNFFKGFLQGGIVAGLNHVAHLKEENSRAKTALKKLNLDPKAKPDFSKETVIDLTVRDENLNQMYKDADYPNISLDSELKVLGKTNLSGITLGQKAFQSYRSLYLTLGHEFIHAYHYSSGLMSYWSKGYREKYINEALYKSERGAYSWLRLYDSSSMRYYWENQFQVKYGHLIK